MSLSTDFHESCCIKCLGAADAIRFVRNIASYPSVCSISVRFDIKLMIIKIFLSLKTCMKGIKVTTLLLES